MTLWSPFGRFRPLSKKAQPFNITNFTLKAPTKKSEPPDWEAPKS